MAWYTPIARPARSISRYIASSASQAAVLGILCMCILTKLELNSIGNHLSLSEDEAAHLIVSGMVQVADM